MRKVARRLVVVCLACAVLTLLSLASAYLALQRVPQFYREALAQAPQPDSGQRLERAALDLHNQSQHVGRWEARVTQDEINGWLAVDLPTKFPKLLPTEISEPRAVISDGKFYLAARYRWRGVEAVVSATGETYLTSQPNEIAVRVLGAHAGALPIPIGRLLADASDWASRASVSLRWSELRGAPVLLIRLPADDDSRGRRLLIDHLRCVRGEITLGGHTEDARGEAAIEAAAVQSADKEHRQR